MPQIFWATCPFCNTRFTCEKENEIPVGNTIDEAEKWSREFMAVANEFIIRKATPLIEYITKIGAKDPKSYCECNSKCDSGDFACLPKCETAKEGGCEIKLCDGNPCQQMIGLLVGRKDPCGGDGVKKYSNQVKEGLKPVKNFISNNQRSDILKSLVYSRKAINSCSQNYAKQTKVLSCTRVEDEIMPPIIGGSNPGVAIINGTATSSYCYGQALGEIKGTTNPTADNWFCCQAK